MDDLERRLFWYLLPGVGAAPKQHLLAHYSRLPDPADLCKDLCRQLELPGERIQRALSRDKDPIWREIREQKQRLADLGCHLLEPGCTHYPPLLAEIPDPPVHLFVVGKLERLRWPQFAIVGSRKATQAGLADAGRFARALAEAGFTVTSGLAEGIDTAAHRAALGIRAGTLAVIGSGPDVSYPVRNRSLQEQIMREHCLVSEHAPGTMPRAGHFPRRNRIISGLSTGVLVVEASQRSGSLITARLALEQGRDVFALPGSIHEPRKRGCHRLIRQGAALVSSLDDLKEELDGLIGFQLELAQTRLQNIAELGADASKLLKSLEFDPLDLDRLVSLSGLDQLRVQAALVELELAGQAGRTAGGYVRTAA